MPQIWMTYQEIATLLDCDIEQAQSKVEHRLLDRRKSRDGRTRVKLDPVWTARFYTSIGASDQGLNHAIDDLKTAHAEMKRNSGNITSPGKAVG